MSTTHIAGHPVFVGSIHMQRCAWCGEKIIHDDLSRIAVPDGQDWNPSSFPVGELVEMEGTLDSPVCRRSIVPHVDGEQLPKNSCFELVENRIPTSPPRDGVL